MLARLTCSRLSVVAVLDWITDVVLILAIIMVVPR